MQTRKLGIIATGIAALALAGCGSAPEKPEQTQQYVLPRDCEEVLNINYVPQFVSFYVTYKTTSGAFKVRRYDRQNGPVEWVMPTAEKPLEEKVQ